MTQEPIKEGDILIFHNSGLGRNWYAAKVDKITPTGRIKCGNIELDKNLVVRGQGSFPQIIAYRDSPRLRKKVKREANLRYLKMVQFDMLPHAVVGQIVRIIKKSLE